MENTINILRNNVVCKSFLLYVVIYNLIINVFIDFLPQEYQMITIFIITIVILIFMFVVNRKQLFNSFDEDLLNVIERSHVLGVSVFFLFIFNYLLSSFSYIATGYTSLIHATGYTINTNLVLYCLVSILLIPFLNVIVFHVNLYKNTNFLTKNPFVKNIICGFIYGIFQTILGGMIITGIKPYLFFTFIFYFIFYVVLNVLYKKYNFNFMIPTIMTILFNLVSFIVLIS